MIALLAACAGLPTAQIELPAAWAGQAPATIEGVGGRAQGDWRLGALHGRYERSASRLSLFDRYTTDRAVASYTLEPAGIRAACRLHAGTVTRGALQLPVAPASVRCDFAGRGGDALPQRLELDAVVAAAAGTRAERRGRFDAGQGLVLELQSVHHLQGSPLPVSAPAGYLLQHRGQTVAALDLNGSRPRLWQAGAADGALGQAVAQAALALALLWDPADG